MVAVRAVSDCKSFKIVNSLMKFKFIHKFFVIQEKFPVFLSCSKGRM